MRGENNHVPLRELRERAEAFYGANLSSVRIDIDDRCDTVGALAFTYGDAIHLSPQAARLPMPLVAEVVGHELAHALQQAPGLRGRQFIITPREVANQHEALEAEADDLGRRFARWSHEQPAAGQITPAPTNEPFLQRIVTVGKVRIDSTADISRRARLVLNLIPSGTQWLTWAMSTPQPSLSFLDEAGLLGAINQGIHGASLLLLRGENLLVGPSKLLTLNESELNTLQQRAAGESSAAVVTAAEAILTRNELLTIGDLAAADTFLSDVGIAGAPLFAIRSLGERIALHRLLQDSKAGPARAPRVQAVAARYALDVATTVEEFTDFYRFYTTVLAKRRAINSPPSDQRRLVDEDVRTLRPIMFYALDCPSLPVLPAPAAVGKTLQDWIKSGNQLGFTRVSSGMLAIARDSCYGDQVGDDAYELVRNYLVQANGFLSENTPVSAMLGQDGKNAAFRYAAGDHHANVELDEYGHLTLMKFGLSGRSGEPSGIDTEHPTENPETS